MRILITGGTGYLGRAIVQAAVARGHEPVVFARRASTSGLPGRLVNGDIRDGAAVSRAAAGCAAICHTAALVSVWRPRRLDFDEVNVGGLLNVLEAGRAAGVTRIVYTSTFLALPPSDRGADDVPGRWNDYQRTKVEADRLAAQAVAAGAPLVRTYPGVVYGPGVMTEGNLIGGMIRDHLAGRLPGLIGADRLWSFAFIADVAAAHVTALERGRIGERYILAGENVPQVRVFEIVRALTDRPLPRRVPVAAAWLIAVVEELKARLTGRPPLVTRGTVEIFRHDWAYDSALARREFDYRVPPLADGIRETLTALGAGRS